MWKKHFVVQRNQKFQNLMIPKTDAVKPKNTALNFHEEAIIPWVDI